MIENVWVVADRSSHDLGAVWPGRPLALLPIAGRALIEYVMDELFEARIPRATVALSSEVAACREILADGHRWGVELRETLTRGETSTRRILADAPEGDAGATLLVYADRFRTPAVASFLRVARRLGPRRAGEEPGFRPGTIVAVGEDGRPLGIELVRGVGGPRRTLVLPNTCSFDVATADGIHAAHLATVGGLVRVALHAREIDDGVWAGRQVQLGADVTLRAPVFLGPGCEIGGGAVVGPNAFIGPHCFLEPGAVVRNAALLEHTFVSPGVAIENAVANGKASTPLTTELAPEAPETRGMEPAIARIYDRPTAGVEARAENAGLSRLDAPAALQWLSSRLMRISLGLALAVLLPALLLWYALAYLAEPRAPLRRRVLRSNRSTKGTFLAFESTAWPYLRRLPWLLAVLTGDLDLVGVRPDAAEADSTRPWRREIVGRARAGVLSPALLLDDATPLAQDLAEAAWLADRSWRSDALLVGRMLLHALGGRRGAAAATHVGTAP